MTKPFDPLFYAFGVIRLNYARFTEWELDYYSGKYEGANPHGLDNKIWAEAMACYLAEAEYHKQGQPF